MHRYRDVTFVIADDHLADRKAVKAILEAEGFRALGEASDGNEAVRRCWELRPDVAVLDDLMPGMNGLDATRLIIMNRPSTRVMILTEHPSVPQLLESIVVGASAYISKAAATAGLLDAFKAVSDGVTYVRASCNHRQILTSRAREGATPELFENGKPE